jgi:hypothetical protein
LKSARLARPAQSIRRHSPPHPASAIPAQAPPNRHSDPQVWCLRIAYALATIASQSGRGQPLSPPQEVIVVVRHYTSPSGYPPDTLRMPSGRHTDWLTGAWPLPPNRPHASQQLLAMPEAGKGKWLKAIKAACVRRASNSARRSCAARANAPSTPRPPSTGPGLKRSPIQRYHRAVLEVCNKVARRLLPVIGHLSQ